MSVLEQHTSKNATSRTQFTFTLDSDNRKSMQWPVPDPSISGAYPDAPDYIQDQRDIPPHATQMSAGVPGQSNQTQNANRSNSRNVQGNLPPQQTATQQPERRPRRSLMKQLALQARNRKLDLQYNNYHHPPRKEDVYMCAFCEYENIYGCPPAALIQQYEMKDRRVKKDAEKRRRHLEKFKMKNRKGKKGNKGATKNNATAATASESQMAAQQYDNQHADDPLLQNPPTQNEEDVAGDYDDDALDMPGAMPLSPAHSSRPVRQNSDHPGGLTASERALAA